MQIPRPGRQPVEVGGTEPSGRAGEQAHEHVATGRVAGHREQGMEIGDLRSEEQPSDADDLDGHAALPQGVDDGGELGASAAEHRGRAPAGSARRPLR